MNKINITDINQPIPATTPNLKLLQDAIHSLQELAAMGSADNYILSGCTVAGTTVSAGWVVINGELLPFQGGTLAPGATVTIGETGENVEILGVNYPNLRILRKVIIATGSGANYFEWSGFKRIKSLATLEAMLPTVYVQPTEPATAKDGDFWVIN